jgi:hypothetical protein
MSQPLLSQAIFPQKHPTPVKERHNLFKYNKFQNTTLKKLHILV